VKISLNWLKDYVALDASVDEITRAITFLGFEVEGVASTGAPKLQNVVVGEILTRAKHPNADKLSVCTVDIGPAGGVKTIVCGASNCDAGNRVPVALPGAIEAESLTVDFLAIVALAVFSVIAATGWFTVMLFLTTVVFVITLPFLSTVCETMVMVIVALPPPINVTLPFASTAATAGLLELYATDLRL
jgi:hypothetical protein